MHVHYSIKTDETLSEDVIVSSHAVQSDVECSMKCLEKSPTCVGYNYRSKSNRYAVNCQLSNKTRGKDQATGANKKWALLSKFGRGANKNLLSEIKIQKFGRKNMIKNLFIMHVKGLRILCNKWMPQFFPRLFHKKSEQDTENDNIQLLV